MAVARRVGGEERWQAVHAGRRRRARRAAEKAKRDARRARRERVSPMVGDAGGSAYPVDGRMGRAQTGGVAVIRRFFFTPLRERSRIRSSRKDAKQSFDSLRLCAKFFRDGHLRKGAKKEVV